ncbi:MAG: DUF4956 domain-containing protein [Oscillospiraceae bacterium]|nr:DUF4956 domain-containing protein [Oscillospiraceae bacterium]
MVSRTLAKALTLVMILAIAASMAITAAASDLSDFGITSGGDVGFGGTDTRTVLLVEPGASNWKSANWKCNNCSWGYLNDTTNKPSFYIQSLERSVDCFVCETDNVVRTSGGWVRFLVGNIRPIPDAFGRPTDTAGTFFVLIASALVLGFVMSLLYKAVTRKGQPSSANFATTLVMLPPVITMVVFVIGQNLAAAFGLAGVFAMTRFRNSTNNSKDLAFVFVSVALGLSCAMGFVFYAFAIAAVLCIVLLILSTIGYGELKSPPKILRINVPESISYNEIFDSILEKYAYSWDVTRVKTIDLGATFEITYSLMTKPQINEKEFIDELRTRNGNLNIILRLDTRREGESR